MKGWGKLVAGTLVGVAGTVYATNEELRKKLPGAARDLPESVRRRFERSVAAAREASARRREEILAELARRERTRGWRESMDGGRQRGREEADAGGEPKKKTATS